MKKNPIIYAVVFGGCVVSLSLWNYLSGRFGFHYTILFILPGIVLLGTTFFAAGSVVFGSLGSVSEGRFMTAIFAMLLFGTFGGLPLLIHGNCYLLGVRQQISSLMTPAQIRQAAQATAPMGSKDNGLSRLGPLLSRLPGPYGVVIGLGGCAVCGHTGLQVQEPTITNRYSKGGHLSIAPDIEVFYDPR